MEKLLILGITAITAIVISMGNIKATNHQNNIPITYSISSNQTNEVKMLQELQDIKIELQKTKELAKDLALSGGEHDYTIRE